MFAEEQRYIDVLEELSEGSLSARHAVVIAHRDRGWYSPHPANGEFIVLVPPRETPFEGASVL